MIIASYVDDYMLISMAWFCRNVKEKKKKTLIEVGDGGFLSGYNNHLLFDKTK
jgi:hypothetical protein